jgi:HEAT repeat protein
VLQRGSLDGTKFSLAVPHLSKVKQAAAGFPKLVFPSKAVLHEAQDSTAIDNSFLHSKSMQTRWCLALIVMLAAGSCTKSPLDVALAEVESADVSVRAAAVDHLAHMGSAAAAAVLPKLTHPDASVRVAAALVLSKVEDRDAHAALRRMAFPAQPEAAAWRRNLETLAAAGTAPALEPLTELIRGEEPAASAAALQVMVAAKQPVELIDVIHCLNHGDAALSQLCVALLEDAGSRGRAAVRRYLAEISLVHDAPAAVMSLLGLVDKCHDEDAVAAIEHCAQLPDKALSLQAVKVLAGLEGGANLALANLLTGQHDSEMLAAILKALHRQGTTGVDVIFANLTTKDPILQKAVIADLGRGDEAILRRALRSLVSAEGATLDGNRNVLMEAGERSIPLLLSLLRTGSPDEGGHAQDPLTLILRAPAADLLNRVLGGMSKLATEDRALCLLATRRWQDLPACGAKAVDTVRPFLRSRDLEVCRGVANMLREVHYQAADADERALIAALNRDYAAAAACGDEGVGSLADALKSETGKSLESVVGALAVCESPKAATVLLGVADSGSYGSDMRRLAAEALINLGRKGPPGFFLLIDLLGSCPFEETRERTLQALESRRGEAIAEMRARLKIPDYQKLGDVILALADMQAKEAADDIRALQAARGPSARTHITFVSALARLGDGAAVDVAVEMLSTTTGAQRLEWVRALGKSRSPKAYEPLAKLAHKLKENTDEQLRAAAMDALGDLGDKRALEVLMIPYASEDDAGRAAKARALLKLNPERGLYKILDEAEYGKPTEPMLALLKKNMVTVLKALLPSMRSSLYPDHDKAVALLKNLGYQPKGEDTLLWLLACEDWDELAAEGQKAVPVLKGFLMAERHTDDESAKCAKAAQLLAGIGKSALPALGECMSAPHQQGRFAAYRAAGETNNPALLPALVAALPDWDCRSELLAALTSLKWQPTTDPQHVYAALGTRDRKWLDSNRELTTIVLLKDCASESNRKMEHGVSALVVLGWEETIPKLIALLSGNGSKEMAAVFLNCGRHELSEAGQEWAKRHGYQVWSYPTQRGSNAGWGGF